MGNQLPQYFSEGSQIHNMCCLSREDIPKIKKYERDMVRNEKGEIHVDGKYIDPKSVVDPLVAFKYNFPFYRMDIGIFSDILIKMRHDRPLISKDTHFISITELKQYFFMIDSWKEKWSNIERLLKAPALKEMVCTYHTKNQFQIDMEVPDDQKLYYTTKLELGVIALLWCGGS